MVCCLLYTIHGINPAFCCYTKLTIIIIICSIAIAYSMGQIIKSVCVCQSVCQCICVSICAHSHGNISGSIFPKIGTDVRTLKIKNEFIRGHRTSPSLILPPNPHFTPRGLKTHANIKQSYICPKCTRIAKFQRFVGNRGQGTRRWCQILDRK